MLCTYLAPKIFYYNPLHFNSQRNGPPQSYSPGRKKINLNSDYTENLVITYEFSPLWNLYHQLFHEQANPMLSKCFPSMFFLCMTRTEVKTYHLSTVRQIPVSSVSLGVLTQNKHFQTPGDYSDTIVFPVSTCESGIQNLQILSFFLLIS